MATLGSLSGFVLLIPIISDSAALSRSVERKIKHTINNR